MHQIGKNAQVRERPAKPVVAKVQLPQIGEGAQVGD